MKTRFKVYVGILLAAGLAVLGTTAFYKQSVRESAAARARFEARYAASGERVAALIQTAAGAKPQSPGGKTPRHPAGRPAGIKTASPPPPAVPPTRSIVDEVSLLVGKTNDMYRIHLEWPTAVSCEIGPAGLDGHGGLRPEDRRKLLEKARNRFMAESLGNKARQDAARAEQLDLLRGAELREGLDRLEALLLQPVWTPPDLRQYSFSRPWSFHRLLTLAMLRALGRDQPERAARLLVRWLDFHEICVLTYYPEDAGTGYSRDYCQLLTTLGELPQFPGEALDQAARRLEDLRLTPQRQRELRQAYALRWAKYYGGLPFSQGENFIHWIQIRDVGPDTLMLRLLQPRLRQTMFDYAAAWETGDQAKMKRGLAQARRLGTLANLNPGAIRDGMSNIGHGFYPDEGSTQDLNCVVAAAVRYRRATGRSPANMESLMPQYYTPPPDVAVKDRWRLESLEETGSDAPARTVFYRIQESIRYTSKYTSSTLYQTLGSNPARQLEQLKLEGHHLMGQVTLAAGIIFSSPKNAVQLIELFREADRLGPETSPSAPKTN